MTETTHTRSRRASLGGLALQLVAFGGTLALSKATGSTALYHLAWYLLGGVPIWFVALLVFRQRELAALEALDLEELRREKQAVAGGEALFGPEGAAGLGFRVAEARLRWMQRWLIPGFGLAHAAYLAAAGLTLWRSLTAGRLVEGVKLPALEIGGPGWPELSYVPHAMVALAILMLGTFLLSRYTSGMARVEQWQLLRGCGSYMLGNALASMALLVCLGVQQYAGVATWEHALAYAIPVVMIVLALETLVNFVLDIYRPRAAGVEPRACFDSRLLGLIAEPGGIASSIAEAINYQFGFQVSQTWFYKLLQRTFAWLVLAGAASLWLLSCIVIVQPYEHAIVERFGRQLNADSPLPPGLHFKLPWPIEKVRAYNTGQLHQINVGFKQYDAVPDYEAAMKGVMLWTDERHLGQEHFDFLICPSRREPEAGGAPFPSQPEGQEAAREADTPVHLFRMDVAVQYRIRPDKLHLYSRVMSERDVHRAVLNIAWEEVSRLNASSTADSLLSEELIRLGQHLRDRMTPRVAALGLEVVYVGVTNVHPEKSVAEAFRNVVKAEQEKIAAIREALVTENERLSRVAGDVARARALAGAVMRNREADAAVASTAQVLAAADPEIVGRLSQRLVDLEALFLARVEAEARLDAARDRQKEIELEFELGAGQTAQQREAAARAVAEAEAAVAAATRELETALEPLRSEAEGSLRPEQVSALIEGAGARVARAYWEEKLQAGFTPSRLEGEAAAMLARALANRWTIEMQRAGELAQAINEREAYRAAPEVYKARRLAEVLVQGMKDARKFFLAFDPGGRKVRVRFIAEDQWRLDLTEIRPQTD